MIEPSSAGDIHGAGLLLRVFSAGDGLKAVAGPSLVLCWAAKPVTGAASGCANVAAVAAWRWSSDDGTGAAGRRDGAEEVVDEDDVAEVVGATEVTGVSKRAA